MPRHVFPFQVRWSDMDPFGHVNNVAYLTYLEEARVDMLFVHAAQSGGEALAGGVVVAEHQIRYRAPLVFRPEPVRVETWVSHLGNSSFTLDYEVRDDEMLFATARSVLVPYDVAARRARRVSPGEQRALERYLETELV